MLGSADCGQEWAGAALITPKLRSRLRGNLAIIHDQQITSTDTRPAPLDAGTGDQQPEVEPVSAPQPIRAIRLAAGEVALLLLALMVALTIWWQRSGVRAVHRS